LSPAFNASAAKSYYAHELIRGIFRSADAFITLAGPRKMLHRIMESSTASNACGFSAKCPTPARCPDPRVTVFRLRSDHAKSGGNPMSELPSVFRVIRYGMFLARNLAMDACGPLLKA